MLYLYYVILNEWKWGPKKKKEKKKKMFLFKKLNEK